MIPKDWALGLIFPIFKEGDLRVPDNYRGITLLSVVGKLYSMILNQRVTAWCEAHRVLVEEQAGFRPGRSTLDHLFSLSEIIRTRKNLGKKTHCCFLDIREAYDRVFRVGLWKRMLDVGINGKIWRVIRQLYEVVESCVLVGNQQTGWFSVDVGLRQGCNMSPILFAIFIDGLAREVRRANQGVRILDLKINILLFADDIILLGSSRQELQKLLDIVSCYSEKWKFAFNGNKSKVVVFGTQAVSRERYFLGFQQLEVVNQFKYLGVDFKNNFSWKDHKNRIGKKAHSRVAGINKVVAEGLTIEAGEKLWTSMIRLTLEYGAEVWGGGRWIEAEHIMRKVGKTLLGLPGRQTMKWCKVS